MKFNSVTCRSMGRWTRASSAGRLRYHQCQRENRIAMSIQISIQKSIQRLTKVVVAGALLTTAVLLAAQAAQAPRYRAPRADGGKPDLNGIWQAMNEANYDLEGHMAKPALALRPGP